MDNIVVAAGEEPIKERGIEEDGIGWVVEGGGGEEASDSGEEGGKGGRGVVVDNSVVHMFGRLTLLHTCIANVSN